MCRKVLFASGGARESLVALRKGALIARSRQAQAHLPIIDWVNPMSRREGFKEAFLSNFGYQG